MEHTLTLSGDSNFRAIRQLVRKIGPLFLAFLPGVGDATGTVALQSVALQYSRPREQAANIVVVCQQVSVAVACAFFGVGIDDYDRNFT